MKLISPLLKHVVYPGLSKAGYLRPSAQAEPAVITYHGVYPSGYRPRAFTLDGHLVTAGAFRAQILLLQSRYNLISPDQFRLWCKDECKLPPRSVLLTCDDGLLNTLTDMLPIIRERDVPFLFFVTGASASGLGSMLWHEELELWRAHIGNRIVLQTPWRREPYKASGQAQTLSLWLELRRQLSAFDTCTRLSILRDMRIQLGIAEDWRSEYSQNEPLRRRFFMLDRDQLHQLADAGITIGAHTMSHPMLSQMPEDLAFRETAESRRQLEKELGREVWALAYPFGNGEAVSAREADLARRAGFSCAFMNVENTPAANTFALPRIHVSADMGVSEFEAHVSGFYRSLRARTLRVAAGNPA
jgi:peptidoglycan/xylan/chitin deacetylase (PgdA/CDA1 family)